jgi:quinol-cytochrome oxidoreductase complex cytochrome b subunit
MVPTVLFPPPMPFTWKVTEVFVASVLFERVTCAVMSIGVLKSTVAAKGESVIEVTVAVPLLLLPPHADRTRVNSPARNKTARVEVFVLMVSGLIITFIISFLSAL